MINLSDDRLINGRAYWFVTDDGEVDLEHIREVQINKEGICIFASADPVYSNGAANRGHKPPTDVKCWFEEESEARECAKNKVRWKLNKRREELMEEVETIDKRLKELRNE